MKKSAYSAAAVTVLGTGVGLADATSEIIGKPYAVASAVMEDDEVTHSNFKGKAAIELSGPGAAAGAAFSVSCTNGGTLVKKTATLGISGAVDPVSEDFSSSEFGNPVPNAVIHEYVGDTNRSQTVLVVSATSTSTADSITVTGSFSIQSFSWTWNTITESWDLDTPVVPPHDTATFSMKVEKVDPTP